MTLDELKKWEDKLTVQYGLDGVVDNETKCGV
jgi:hypothetical protein